MADLLCAGVSANTMGIVGCSERLVFKVKKLAKDRETLARKPGSGGHNKKDVGLAVVATIEADLTTSMRQMAKELGVADGTLRQRVKEMGPKSYIRRQRQLLSEASKKSREERGKKSSRG